MGYSVNDYFGVVYFKGHKNRFFTAIFGQKKTETPIFQGISVVLPKVYLGGRSEVIRTPDFFVPNEALYQTEPHPEIDIKF